MSFPFVKLDSICRPKQWKTIATSQLIHEGYPVYGANGKIGFYSKYTHEKPTVMITCRGATCGNIHISEAKSYINGNAMALDAVDENVVDLSYLKYCLESRGLKDIISGSAQPQITRQGLSSVKIPLPPLKTQKQIAVILEKADQLRKDCQQMEQELNNLAQSVFIDMFGDPVSNPKGWEKTTISNVCEVKTGSTPKRGVDGYYGGTIPWIKTGEVVGDFIYDSEEKITRKAIKETNCKAFPKNTILLAMYGQGKTRGRVGVLGEEAATNQACAAICPSEKIDPLFLFYYLKTQYQELRRLGRGGNQENLNLSMVKDYEIILPPPCGQKSYVESVNKINQLISGNRKSKLEFERNFSSLMQKAFTGRLKITQAA